MSFSVQLATAFSLKEPYWYKNRDLNSFKQENFRQNNSCIAQMFQRSELFSEEHVHLMLPVQTNSISLRVCFDLFALDRLCLRSLASAASQRCSILPHRSSSVQGCVSFSCLWCKFYSSLTLKFLPPILPSPPAAKWRQRSCFSPPLVWWLSERGPINLN